MSQVCYIKLYSCFTSQYYYTLWSESDMNIIVVSYKQGIDIALNPDHSHFARHFLVEV